MMMDTGASAQQHGMQSQPDWCASCSSRCCVHREPTPAPTSPSAATRRKARQGHGRGLAVGRLYQRRGRLARQPTDAASALRSPRLLLHCLQAWRHGRRSATATWPSARRSARGRR